VSRAAAQRDVLRQRAAARVAERRSGGGGGGGGEYLGASGV